MTVRRILELRARIRRGLRAVFDGRGFVEVDTPVLSREVLPEAQIDPIPVFLDGDERPRFLQASPEALMKRLLAREAGPIYQFAESFRAGERGRQHDVEFCLLEWYEPGSTLDDAAGLLDALCAAALGSHGLDRLTCRDAFVAHAGVDPMIVRVRPGDSELISITGAKTPTGIPREPPKERERPSKPYGQGGGRSGGFNRGGPRRCGGGSGGGKPSYSRSRGRD